MDFTIRKANGIDIPRIIELLKQVAEVHSNIRPDLFKANSNKYNKSDLAVMLYNGNAKIFVAADTNDIAVGYIFCVIHEYKNHMIMQNLKTLYIDDICVDKTIRGSGIGQALYNNACEYAKEQGCYNVALNVWSGNDNALHFYEKLDLKEQKRTLEMIL